MCDAHTGLQDNPVAGRAPSEHDTALRAVDNREPLCCRFVAGAPATGHTSCSGVRRSVSRVENSPIPKVIALANYAFAGAIYCAHTVGAPQEHACSQVRSRNRR
jgi:hypothetical protein